MATRANGIMKQIALSMYHMLRKTKGVLCTKYVQDVKRKSNLKNMERIRVANLPNMSLIGSSPLARGTAQHVTYLTIKNIILTLNDLARKLLLEMQKSELVTKAPEEEPKSFSRLLNKQVIKVTECTNDAWVLNLRATLSS
jgi:hypothetical protein